MAHPIVTKRFTCKLFVFALFLLFVPLSGVAQTQEKKDSLFAKLKNVRSDVERIDILNELSYAHYDFDDSIGFYYGREALSLAQKTDYPKGLQFAYTLVGVGYFSFGDYENALISFQRSHSIPFSESDLDRHLYNIMLTGNVMADLGHYDSARVILQEGLNIAIKNKSIKREASISKAFARIQARLWQNDKALQNLRHADSLQTNKSKYEQTDIKYLYSLAYLNQSDLINAAIQIQGLCEGVKEIDDNFHKSLCHLMQSELYRKQGKSTAALNEAFQSLEITEVYTYPYLRAQIFLQIGIIYSDMSQYPIALEFLFRTLKIAEKSKIDPLTASAFVELGWIFKEQKNYTVALDYLNQAEFLCKKMGDKKGEASAHNTRGLIFLFQKKYDAAISEHQIALSIREAINYPTGIASSLYNLSLVYEELGDFDQALDLQKRSLIIEEKINEPISLNESYLGVASLFIKLNQIDKAEIYLKKSDLLAKQTNSKTIQRANYRVATLFYEEKGDYKKALAFSQMFRGINDSIFSENNNLKIAEMQSLYDVERKQQQIELLSKESELQANQLTLQKVRLSNQRIIIITGGLILFLITGIMFYSIKTNRKLKFTQLSLAETNEELMTQSEELRESNESLVEIYSKILKQQEEIEAQAEELRGANETISTINQHLEEKVEERTQQLKQAYVELDTFFYRSSHDFRRPITTFIGLAEVAKITSKDESTLELFAKVKETALSLDRMIRKLQTISDVGAQKMVYKEVLMRELVSNILDNHKDDLSPKSIKVIQEIEIHNAFVSYGALVNVIIENLIENAIQFATPLNPFIKIIASSTENSIIIQIEDNGQGIPEEYHARIFDMYFRASISSKGNGLGLYIVKKAVDKLEGTIRFKTTMNHGSIFTVELPLHHS